MGKSSPSAPAAPDPVATAQAQAIANIDTARVNASLNRVNQYGPDGSIVYTPSEGDRWSQTTTLSPEAQRILDQTRSAQGLYADIGSTQLQGVQGALSQAFQDPYAAVSAGAVQRGQQATQTPFQDPYAGVTSDAIRRAQQIAQTPVDTDYNKIRQQSIDAANSRLDPMFARDEEAMRARLLAQGVGSGTEAWGNEYRDFNQGRNDARMQVLMNAENLTGQSINQTGALRQIPMNELGQVQTMGGAGLQQYAAARQAGLGEAAGLQNLASSGMQQAAAARAVPLNETSALLTGQQVTIPGVSQVAQTNVAPTDYMGAVGMNQAAQDAAYKARLATYNANLSGQYGLASAAIIAGASMSDRRLKTDIEKIGKTEGGNNIYRYRFRDDPTGRMQIGVMAQELMKKRPDAVHNFGGFYAVDYDKVA